MQVKGTSGTNENKHYEDKIKQQKHTDIPSRPFYSLIYLLVTITKKSILYARTSQNTTAYL